MKIEKNKVVSLSYDLRTENHESKIIESATKEQPLRFIYDNGAMLPAFEKNLAGLSEGDNFQFKLSADEAYGQILEENIIDIPKKAFETEGKIQEGLLTEGNVIPLQDQQGNRFDGIVKKVNEQTVTMDFNHPMAGKDLYFTGKIISVRDATDEELQHGHVH
jgi:FKBP-type peptidyl-prolyl cis-trans isomerase SlyD